MYKTINFFNSKSPLTEFQRLNNTYLIYWQNGFYFYRTSKKSLGAPEISWGFQVTVGYFDKTPNPPFKDGWLMRGYIGNLTAEGSLFILARKKELIKTFHGKYIYFEKNRMYDSRNKLAVSPKTLGCLMSRLCCGLSRRKTIFFHLTLTCCLAGSINFGKSCQPRTELAR